MTRWALLVSIALSWSLPAAAVDRSKPPAPGPPPPLQLPPVQAKALSNGLVVHLAESHEVPTVEVLVAIRAGAGADPPQRPGVAAMTADMLDEGAGGRDALALSEALDLLGASLTTSASWDASLVRLHVSVARLKDALPLLADVVLRPEFPRAELDRLRRDALTARLEARDDPEELATAALDAAVFGPGHRYGTPEDGDGRSIAAISVEDLRAFHARYYRPDDALVVVVGDVDASVLPLLESSLGAWTRGRAPAPPLPAPAAAQGHRIWLVDRPGSQQSAIRVGGVGPARATADYASLEVANSLLGGSFTSRLNDNLREQHGYAYGAGSIFAYRRVAGLFYAAADVQTRSTAEALAEIVKELRRIRTRAIEEDVVRARNYRALGYAFEFETNRQKSSKLATQALFDLPGDTFTTFIPSVLATGPKDVERVARRYVDPDHLAIVVVGDRRQVEVPLLALKLGEVRVLGVDDVMGPAPQIR